MAGGVPLRTLFGCWDMADSSGAVGASPASVRPMGSAGQPSQSVSRISYAALLLAGAAFGLYWLSSYILQARNGITHFGADAHVYTLIAQGTTVDGLTRFHPVTVAAGVAWMQVFKPLIPWIGANQILKAMFAAVGAVGVWGAFRAFATLMPRGQALLFAAIYATSLGVWYFSSIEESKIVTTTLSVLYIAAYLHLRETWTRSGAVLLTVILLLACLNEIVACFLVMIPAVDTLIQRGWHPRHHWWIVLHALAAPLALLILEGLINGRLIPAEANPQRGSHLTMLITYVSGNEYNASSLGYFIGEWFFFSFVAPRPDAFVGANPWLNFSGTFESNLANYFSSPVTACLAAVVAAMVTAGALLGPRPGSDNAAIRSLFFALLAYALLRAAFFYVFLPREPLLNSSATTLVHLLLLGIAFASSRMPFKGALLSVLAGLMLVANGAFIIGP